MVKGMTTCHICGRDFPLIVEEHYIARDNAPAGLARLTNAESDLFDAIDCPHCGSQCVLQQRKREQIDCPCDFGICDECDEQQEATSNE